MFYSYYEISVGCVTRFELCFSRQTLMNGRLGLELLFCSNGTFDELSSSCLSLGVED